MSTVHTRRHCIVPPYLLRALLDSDDGSVRRTALNSLLTSASIRGRRTALAGSLGMAADGRRTIFDVENGSALARAAVVRTEDGPPAADDSANKAFDGLGDTRQFYAEVFGRNSIDDRGLRLNGYIHRGVRFNNAFWDGLEMVFGDGDGVLFTDFTGSIDVIAHELTHGVTEHTAALEYHHQPGALNESISDAFGEMVKQWTLNQTADEADWLVGTEIFTPGVDADALRSMRAPGTAYDNAQFGQDPQPDHMDRYADLPDTDEGDYGGVHINSGIPNKAFYLVATAIGGNSWNAPGHIWYEALKASTATTDFSAFAATTYAQAVRLYGQTEQQAVRDAWEQVGVEGAG
ncbi:M4 family metallopeptidase [Cryptosporangium sp. NPDC051539]|uniref:M4 family metallopeptidase n=1 Tax=Cryptosporangium sp. NPDC051539 TaxID=3363962 RepID=UPI0037A0937F